MRNFNHVVVVGHLGSAPKLFNTGGKPFATFNIACNRSWKHDGEEYTRTDWFSVLLNNSLAQLAQNFLTQGSKVLVQGELRNQEWFNQKDGKKRFKTVIVAKSIEFLSTKIAQSKTANAYDEPISETDEDAQNDNESHVDDVDMI